jgi:flagellar motility protein MotE (MotC chaperone)
VKELITKLEELHKYSLGRYEELEDAFDNEDYEEELTDTLIRKYEEGYSDAIAMVLTSLKDNN